VLTCSASRCSDKFDLVFVDDEGDEVCIGTEFELQDAINMFKGSGELRVFLKHGNAVGPGQDLANQSPMLGNDPTFVDNMNVVSVAAPPLAVQSLPGITLGQSFPSRPVKRGAANASLSHSEMPAKLLTRAIPAPPGGGAATSNAAWWPGDGMAPGQASAGSSMSSAKQDQDSDDDAEESSSSSTPNTEEARKIKKRERNRVNAKKSRLRKKFFIDSLKVTIDQLKNENKALKAQLERKEGYVLCHDHGAGSPSFAHDDPTSLLEMHRQKEAHMWC